MQVGDRVQLHPAADRWMMGDRYGQIEIERVVVYGGSIRAEPRHEFLVRFDRSGECAWVSQRDLRPVQ